MIDEFTVPLMGTLETNPDAIPRGFIHTDPDILNIQQQNTLTEMKVKMMDFNNEYLAKHPQVEALVRLLIKELIIHKPYYVREFIKEVLSREDLESQVAKIVAVKQLNTNRRHTRHYFSHIKTWQDKAAGVDEPEAQKEEPYWPEPRPFRVETRRDKREYTHPHYFKVPYVFFPAEYLSPKIPDFKRRRKHRQFRSKSYARLLLKNYRDVWGCPVTDIPPPMNEEEFYTAWSLWKKKPENEMTNEELIKCCWHCRRTRVKNYIYAKDKQELNDPMEGCPSYTNLKKSIQLRFANKCLEKTLEAIQRKDVKTINCAWVPRRKSTFAERELIKFESRFLPHWQIAKMNKFKSPVPGIRFKEEGGYRTLVPLADLKGNVVGGQSEFTPRITITGNKEGKKYGKMTVPTTDLEGNIIEQSEISVTLRKKEDYVASYIRLGDQMIGNTSDMIGENPLNATGAIETAPKEEIQIHSEIRLSKYNPPPRATIKKKVMIRDKSETMKDSIITVKSNYDIVDEEQEEEISDQEEDSLMAIVKETCELTKGSDVASNSSDEIVNEEQEVQKEDSSTAEEGSVEGISDEEESETPLPSDLEDPYMQMIMDCNRVSKHFDKGEKRRKCKINRTLGLEDLKRYL